jgi:hypothetical protein
VKAAAADSRELSGCQQLSVLSRCHGGVLPAWRHSKGLGRFGMMAGLLAIIVGCGPSFGPEARYGIVFYCPGAGNIDFGDRGIREGLAQAGYRGQVASILWTFSLNPAIDQALRVNARLAAGRLARAIEAYKRQYPAGSVNLIGLSAGTGVAIWAVEDLKPGCEVENVILLSSSLWHRYDVGPALRHIKGKIYNLYSSEDPILAGPMKIFGTIDGVFFEDGAGAVGLHPPRGRERVVNIAWRPEFIKYGYYGGHTDVTSPGFVRFAIAPLVLGSKGSELTETAGATDRGSVLLVGRAD